MILLFIRLTEPVKISLNNRSTYLTSILALIDKEKSAIRKTFEKKKFLQNLNQGSLQLRETTILNRKIFSGNNIRGFGYSEQFFVMLSLGIFFVTKVKNVKLKKSFFDVVQNIINDFNTAIPTKLSVRYHKKTVRKMINIFDKLPERGAVISWDVDKLIFRNMLK